MNFTPWARIHRIRWSAAALLLGACSGSKADPPETEAAAEVEAVAAAEIGDRDNERWRAALQHYPGRYSGLDATQVGDVKKLEARFREIMDALTAIDSPGGHHGASHETKPDREQELWTLLGRIPQYPAASRLILAAIVDVYLGFHGNGWWGYWWHWPYLDCAKAVTLADRLIENHPGMEEEALWTKIYCYRVLGWGGSERNGRSGPRGNEAQYNWKPDPKRVRALCEQLQVSHPKGRYAAPAAALLKLPDLVLDLPGYPVAGRTRHDPKAVSMSIVGHTGPDFLLNRADR